MAYAATSPKQQAHELIDAMAPGQVSAVVGLLKIMLDPLARTLASAPFDDEPVSAEEVREIAAARASLACARNADGHRSRLPREPASSRSWSPTTKPTSCASTPT